MVQVVQATLGDILKEKPTKLKAARDKRRRLSAVVGRHADRSRPFIVTRHNARSPLQPNQENVILRDEWRDTLVGKDDVILILYLPERGGGGGGGAGGGGGGRGGGLKTGISIALAVAAVVLTIAAPYLGPVLGTAFVVGTTAISWVSVIQVGLVVGGIALSMLSARAKANKTTQDDNRPVYGIASGGNVPRAGDRIPVGYGRCWHKPDLSQPDASYYDGEDQVLLKRMTVAAGEYTCHAIRAGKQTVWTAAGGYVAPFTAQNFEFELLYGTASTLVPNDIISSPSVVGIALPRPASPTPTSGPFNLNQTGALITRIQVDYSFPNGISSTYTRGTATLSGQLGPWGVHFEYAPIDATGAVIGAWQTIVNESYLTHGMYLSTRPLRFTKYLTVPAGRYAVRGRNLVDEAPSTVNIANWDGARGWTGETRTHPGITEIACRIRSSQALQGAAFGELELDMERKLPTFNGTVWGSPVATRKAVWAFADVMRNTDYGAGLPSNRFDAATVQFYSGIGSPYDEFNGVIRGPVSVWEAASTVLLPFRAEAVNLGRIWTMVRDEQKTSRRHVVTRRKILKGSSQIEFDLDTQEGSAHQVVEFDQDGDYRKVNQTSVYYGIESITPSRRKLPGVRTYEHATHLARWLAASAYYRRERISFSTQYDARIYKRGDPSVIDLWFLNTRRVAGIVSQSGNTLTLDADITFAAGDHAVLRDRTGREWGPVTIQSQGANTRELILNAASRTAAETASGVLLASAIGTDTEVPTAILVGTLSSLQEKYLIQGVKPNGPHHLDVVAVRDAPEVWTALGEAITPQVPSTAPLQDPLIPIIPRVDARAVQSNATNVIEWSITPARGAVQYQIDISYDEQETYSQLSTELSGARELMPTDGTTTIWVRARARGSTGIWGPYTYKSFVVDDPNLGLEVVVDAGSIDSSPPPDLTGISVGSSTTKFPSGEIVSIVTATVNAGTGNIGSYRWEYSVNSGNFFGAPQYGPSVRLVNVAKPGDSIVVRVAPVSKLGFTGNYLTAAAHTVAANTTAPATPAAPTATSLFRSILVTWTATADTDLRYYEIAASATNVIGGATVVGRVGGGATTFVHEGLAANTTRYYFVRAVNNSGVVGAWSPVSNSATTVRAISDDLTDAAITAVKLANDIIDNTKIASGLELPAIVSSLPHKTTQSALYASTPNLVFLSTDSKLYRKDSSTANGWTSAVPAVDITGQIATAQIADEAISRTKFAAGITPVEVLGSLPATGNFAGRTVFLTTNGKLYRHQGTPTDATGFIASVASADISGTIADAQIAALSASKISGTIIASQIADAAISTAKFASGITPVEILGSLPATGNFAGRMVFLTTNDKLYRHQGTPTDASGFVASVASADISGTIADAQIAALSASKISGTIIASQIADEAITTAKFASGITPVEVVGALPTTGNFEGRMVYLTTDNKLYRHTGSPTGSAGFIASLASADISGTIADAQIAALSASKISGTIIAAQIADAAITIAKFASGLTPVEVVGALPTTGNFAGRTVVLTTDGKLYRHQGSPSGSAGFTAAVPSGDISGQLTNSQIADLSAAKITGQITGTQITDSAISTPKLAAGAITAEKIAASAITAEKIAVGTITPNLIMNGGFEDGDHNDLIPPGFSFRSFSAGGHAFVYDTVVVGAGAATYARSGKNAYYIGRGSSTPDDGTFAEFRTDYIPVAEGKQYEASAWVLPFAAPTAGSQGALTIQILWFDYAKANAGTPSTTVLDRVPVPTGYNRYAGSTTVPSGARFAIVRFLLLATNNTQASLMFDEVGLREMAGTTLIEPGAITTGKIATGAVTANEIAANTITAGQILAGAIGTTELAANAVTANKIAAGTITSNEIASNTIVAGNIAGATITGAKIAAGTIAAGNIAAGTITGDKIAGTTITAGNLAANTITAGQIASGAISTDELAAGAVVADKIAAGTITSNEIATNTIVAGNIAGATITGAKIAAGTIAAGNIAAGTITGDRIAATTITGGNLVANTITAGQIASGAINTDELAAGAVVADKIAAGTITSNEIASNTIVAGNIAGATITGAKIAAGTIAAGNIAAGTITGDKIAANTISADKLVANSITAGEIAAGAINTSELASGAVTADIIAAGAITTAKLAVGTLSPNLIVNGSFEADEHATPTPSGFVNRSFSAGGHAYVYDTVVIGAGASGYTKNGKNAYYMGRGSAVSGDGSSVEIRTDYIPISADKLYEVSVWALPISGTGTAGFTVQTLWYDNAKAVLTTPSPVSNVPLLSGYNRYSGSAQPPSTAKFVRIRIIHSSTGNTTPSFMIDEVGLREMAGATLIEDGSIVTDKLATNAVTSDKVLANSIIAGKIAASAVGTDQLAANAVTADKILAGAIVAGKLSIAAISSSTGNLNTNAVQTTHIADGAILTDKLAANAVTAVKISGGTITGDKLSAGTITGDKISGTTISGDKLVAGTITATQLATNAVTADKISAGAIEASKLSIGSYFQNLIRNGNFEDGVHAASTPGTGWTSSFSAGGHGYLYDTVSAGSSAYAKSGKNSWFMGRGGSTIGDGKEATLYSPYVPITEGRQYEVSVWVLPFTLGVAASFVTYMYWFDESQVAISPAFTQIQSIAFTSGGYQRVAATVTAPAGARFARFRVRLTSTAVTQDIMIDDMAIREMAGTTMIEGGAIRASHLITTENVITNTAQIGDALITTAKIGDLQVNTAKIGDLQVNTIKVANGAITSASGARSLAGVKTASVTVTVRAGGTCIVLGDNSGANNSVGSGMVFGQTYVEYSTNAGSSYSYVTNSFPMNNAFRDGGGGHYLGPTVVLGLYTNSSGSDQSVIFRTTSTDNWTTNTVGITVWERAK